MKRNHWFLVAGLIFFFGALGVFLLFPKLEFTVGGAVVNLGYRLQDGFAAYDFQHEEDITPEEVWEEFKEQNDMASSIRKKFPRTARHPLVALLVCMDARIDTVDLSGDTRKNYYVVRTAGSVLNPAEEDMLELAVENGVKVLVLTTHTDCAAEKLAKDPARRLKFPDLVESVDHRDERIKEFLARPGIASRIKEGKLLVKQMVIDTGTENMQALNPED